MSAVTTILDETLASITPVDTALLDKARERLDSLTKPKGSLGGLEEFAARIVAITGDLKPRIDRRVIFVFAADHGVADEGVSAFPKEVTPQMVLNFLKGGAGINVIARHVGAEVVVIDIGVDFAFGDADGLIKRKVVSGSSNIRKGPAMTRDEVIRCIEVGIDLAGEYAAGGVIFGTGEMGIANTTPSSAVAACFTGASVAEVTGRGTGIGDEAYKLKVEVIEDALKLNKPDPADPVDVLAKVGGPEIAGIAGLILGAAARSVPVVVDGFISAAGAIAAARMAPGVKDYLFASHSSVERGHAVMLESMGLKPFIDLNLRLGEGTGAALAVSVIEAGVKIYTEMATFGDAGVSES